MFDLARLPVIPQTSSHAGEQSIAPLGKETQRPVDLTRDANAHSCANLRRLSNRNSKPKRTIGTQVNSVQALVDFQCGRKPSGTSRQICEFVGFAEPFH